MIECVVPNASPLIFLGRIDQMELLSRLSKKIFVPEGVLEELEAGRARDRVMEKVLMWASRHKTLDSILPLSVSSWELGKGESQVIAHSMTHQGTPVLDDLMARRCAQAHGLFVMGTLGILLRAKRLGWIPAARPLLTQL